MTNEIGNAVVNQTTTWPDVFLTIGLAVCVTIVMIQLFNLLKHG